MVVPGKLCRAYHNHLSPTRNPASPFHTNILEGLGLCSFAAVNAGDERTLSSQPINDSFGEIVLRVFEHRLAVCRVGQFESVPGQRALGCAT